MAVRRFMAHCGGGSDPPTVGLMQGSHWAFVGSTVAELVERIAADRKRS